MENYLEIIMQSLLLKDVSPENLGSLLNCVGARRASYKKGGLIFTSGSPAEHVGMVLAGEAQVIREDYFGNRAILTRVQSGDLFGEAFACAGLDTLPVSVEAADDCEILLLDYRKIIHTCPSSCSFHNKLIENMLSIIARKNLLLNNKNEVLSGRTIREKLLAYLAMQAAASGSSSFAIPFNRQELADFLAVDRSALSRELGKLQAEGRIHCRKNQFEIIRH